MKSYTTPAKPKRINSANKGTPTLSDFPEPAAPITNIPLKGLPITNGVPFVCKRI
ncbi:hypothetical protein M080_6034, partial [Bacteroides fragilis str. 3397 T10]